MPKTPPQRPKVDTTTTQQRGDKSPKQTKTKKTN